MKKKFPALLLITPPFILFSRQRFKATFVFCLFSAFAIAQTNQGLAIATFGNTLESDKNVINIYQKNQAEQFEEITGKNTTFENLGAVYGICTDDRGDIYVAAGGVYDPGSNLSFRTHGDNNSATLIYKITGSSIEEGANWEIEDLVIAGEFQKQNNAIPNPAMCGPRRAGLGNISYNIRHNSLYATNLSDGKIYRMDTDGKVLESFDPKFDGEVFKDYYGYAPLGQRPWGIAVKLPAVEKDKNEKMYLYYSRWSEDANNPLFDKVNEIWAIELNLQDGSFLPATEIKMADVPGANGTTLPVSDLSFNEEGDRMLMKTRNIKSYSSFVGTYNENGTAMQLIQQESAWVEDPSIVLNGTSVAYNHPFGALKNGDQFDEEIINLDYELNDKEKVLIGDITYAEKNTPEVKGLSRLKVFPNPSSGEIQINEAPLNASFIVLNSQGQILEQGNITNTNTRINLSAYPNGIYWISVTHEEESFHEKIDKISR